MIWLWIISGVLLLPLLILLPKVHFSGNGSPAGFFFRLKAIGLRAEYITSTGAISGRLLWFKIKRPSNSFRGSILQQTLKKAQQAPAVTPLKSKKSSGNYSNLRLSIPYVFRLLKRLLGCIHADEITVELTIATEDPMTTAILFGALQPVSLLNTPRRTFAIGVDFERSSPDYNLSWSFSIRPIVCGWVIITWAMTLPWRKIWRLYRNQSISED